MIEALPGCKDFKEWPQRWAGVDADEPTGEQILQYFRSFLEHLLEHHLSPKTFRRHAGNLWLLGGEVIRGMSLYPSRRKTSVRNILNQAVNEDGGPLLHGGDEQEQRSFDATCRMFHRFLERGMENRRKGNAEENHAA